MPDAPDFSDLQSWHALFDSICVWRGHADNKALASRFCAASGRDTQSDFDAVLKNLANWRLGRRTPRRQHFALLTKLLDTGAHPTLQERWNELYRMALKSSASSNEAGETNLLSAKTTPAVIVQPAARKWLWAAAGSVAGLLVLSAVAAAMFSSMQAAAESKNAISAKYMVSLSVGQSTVVHAVRPATCGAPAEDWEIVKAQLPNIEIGAWSDGGIGVRRSEACGKAVPARVLRFTATSAGSARTRIQGDRIFIQVQ